MDNQDETNDTDPIIEGPVGLLPDLEQWGIEERDRGICEDTFENRRLLRENRARWIPVFDSKGNPTNLIQAVTAEMREAALAANKSFILTDTRNNDSDYVTADKLLLDPRADNVVPAWVLAATRKWIDIEDERLNGKPNFRPAVKSAPGRCRAKKVDGHRCQNWHNGLRDYDGLCKMHVQSHGSDETYTPNQMTLARNRLNSALLGAVEGLEELALTATSEPVRLGAYKELMDRGGLRGGTEMNVEVVHTVSEARETVEARLAEIRKRADEREQAEREAREEAERLAIESTAPVPEYAEIVVEEDDNDTA